MSIESITERIPKGNRLCPTVREARQKGQKPKYQRAHGVEADELLQRLRKRLRMMPKS